MQARLVLLVLQELLALQAQRVQLETQVLLAVKEILVRKAAPVQLEILASQVQLEIQEQSDKQV